VSDCEVDLCARQTYGNIVEIPFELLGDLICELATRYRQTVPSPVQYMDLSPHDQRVATRISCPANIPGRSCCWLDNRETWGAVSSSGLVDGLMKNHNKPTNNRHEMAPAASISTGSSQPSRSVHALRSASPILTPGRPSTLKEMGFNRLKFHCLLL
jgi:hypothetical protein